MNNTMIGALRVEATLESGKFVDGAKKIKAAANDVEKSTKKSFASVERSASAGGAALKGLAAGISIGLLTSAISKSLEYASSIKKIAGQAGVAARDLQTLRYAATQNGLTVTELDTGLIKLKETMGRVAAGATAPTKALEALQKGLSVKIQGQDPATAFKDISTALARIPDPAKRAAFELAIFGEAGAKLDPLLSKGGGAMDELAKAAQGLGIVLSDRQLQQADETADKLDQVKMVLAAQISGVVADNASSIVTLASALASLTSAIVNFLGSNPTAALGILGALAGARAGGLPGAALGGFAGLVAGSEMGRASALANGDLRFRRDELRKARRRYAEARQTGSVELMAAAERNLRKQTAATQRALAAGASPAPTATGTIPQFLAPKPSKGRGSRPRKGPRDRSGDATFQVEQQLRQADMDILRAKLALAHDYVEQTAISIQMLDLEKEMFMAEQDHKVEQAKRDAAEGKITEAALAEVVASTEKLKAKYEQVDALKRQAVLEEEEVQRKEDYNKLEMVDFDLQREHLEKQRNLAETASERRDIELRLLDLAYRQEKARLEAVLADEKSSYAAQEEARRRLLALNQNYQMDRKSVVNSTAGPLESYLNGLPTTAAKMEEALQQVKVNGLDALTQGIMDTITGVESLGQAFKKVAQQIIADLLRIYIQKTLISALGNILSPGMGSAAASLGGSALGSVGPIGVGATALPAFATGGSFNILGNQGVDRNILSLNGLPIARVSHGERIDVGTANGGGMPMGGSPTFNFYGNNADGRKTGLQAAAAYRAEMARSSKRGY